MTPTHIPFFRLLIAAIFACSGLLASTLPASAQFTPEQVQSVLQTEAAIKRISTAAGRFLQISNEGNVARGDIFLSRPGRLRFDYDSPSPLILVADGRNVIEIDNDLESARRLSLNSTPLRLFLNTDVDFRTTVNILRVEEVEDSVLITMQDRERPNDGTLTLLMSKINFTLQAWQMVDNKGERTTVRLENMAYGISIPPELFQDPGF